MKFYQANRWVAMFWRICMIFVMSSLYVFPASAEANGIIMRSPNIGEEVTNQFRFEGPPLLGEVSYKLKDPEGDIVAEGVVQNDDPFQLVITLADIPQYVIGTYTFIFEVGTTPATPSAGSSSNSYVYRFGIGISPIPTAFWRKW